MLGCAGQPLVAHISLRKAAPENQRLIEALRSTFSCLLTRREATHAASLAGKATL
jgi:hypothetical protein